MAGIGFELKKMFEKKGLLSMVKAYGYAGIVTTGPMLLGIGLLLGIRVLGGVILAPDEDMRVVNGLITVTLLFSLFISDLISMPLTRFTADRIYENRLTRVMPSFYGGSSLLIVIGAVLYGIFLSFTGEDLYGIVICIILYGELVLVWNQINYLTAVKDYCGILLAFFFAVVIALAGCYIGLVVLKLHVIHCMLTTVAAAYGIMAVWYNRTLTRFFPLGKGSTMYFLRALDQYKELMALGLAIALGLFGHILIMWYSPVGHPISGVLREAPIYDISALLAFFSILITTISFVTSVEVNFYPKYKNYFALYNHEGSLRDIEQAEREMKETLIQELTYTFTKQFFATVIFIVGGTLLLPLLPLGMTEDVLGIYRIMCVGYAFYAAGNCVMLIQLYFADNKGALYSGACFAMVANVGTYITSRMDVKYYGVGFLVGGVVFTFVSLALLYRFMRKMMRNTLCSQPILQVERSGLFTRLSESFEAKYREKHPEEYVVSEEVGEAE